MPRDSSSVVLALLRWGSLPLALELAALGGLPGPRKVALVVGAWAILALVVPSIARRGGRRLEASAGLVLASLSAGFLGVETLAQRLFPDLPLEIAPDPGSPTPLVQRDPELRGRFTPGFQGRFLRWTYRGVPVRINEQGFRDRPWTPKGESEATRLLAVGDSFTFGTGVPEEATFLRELERLAGGTDSLLTFNAAVPGFGPIDERIVLERVLDDVAPNVVIVGFYSGNDLEDVLLGEGRLGRIATAPPSEAPAGDPSPRPLHLPALLARLASAEYWTENSRAAALVQPGLLQAAAAMGIAAIDVEPGPLLRANARRLDPETDALLDRTADVLAEAGGLARARGARFAVVLIPLRQLVTEEAFGGALASMGGAHPEDFAPGLLHERIARRLGERGVAVLDLLPRIRERVEAGDDLFFSEGHLNEAGHREVARALAEFLLPEEAAHEAEDALTDR